MSIAKRNSVLARAAAGVLYGAKEGEGAGGGAGNAAPDKIELTADELESKLEEARQSAVKTERDKRKQAEKEKRDRERRERGEDEEEEDPREVVAKAEARAAKAEQEAAAAKRDSMVAKVESKLNAYLVANHKDFLGNVVDIMAHVEKALSPDGSDTEQSISRLIEAHTKAFVERVTKSRGAHGAPAGGTRGKLPQGSPIGVGGAVSGEDRAMKPREASPRRPFQTINWHG